MKKNNEDPEKKVCFEMAETIDTNYFGTNPMHTSSNYDNKPRTNKERVGGLKPPPPPEDEDIEGEWNSVWDETCKAYYFYNDKTNEVTWSQKTKGKTQI